jgi:hypothetical protein
MSRTLESELRTARFQIWEQWSRNCSGRLPWLRGSVESVESSLRSRALQSIETSSCTQLQIKQVNTAHSARLLRPGHVPRHRQLTQFEARSKVRPQHHPCVPGNSLPPICTPRQHDSVATRPSAMTKHNGEIPALCSQQ